MGTLVARAYPTTTFANLADHTYVECLGGGKKWGCWGGKTGGRVIAQGPASTTRADCIAKPDERAGIRCYLVNGVCHQAANRILIEARVTVRMARGYSISSALFGTYGRKLFWPCASPFNRCPGVAGDLPACEDPGLPGDPVGVRGDDPMGAREAAYVEAVLEMYAAQEAAPDAPLRGREDKFHVDLFLHYARYQMGERFERAGSQLEEIRAGTEEELWRLQQGFDDGRADLRVYLAGFEALTMRFQELMAKALSGADYRALFALHPEERVSLIDPRIVEAVYGI